MMASSRYLALPVAALFILSGCGNTVVNEQPATAYSFTFVFDLDVRERNEAVFSQGFDVPDITPDVTDAGAVLLYFRDQGTWTALPFTLGMEDPEEPQVDYTATLAYGYDDAFLEVFLEASTDDPVVWDELDEIFGGGISMRAVIIEGVPLSELSVDHQSYDAVESHFDLNEQ